MPRICKRGHVFEGANRQTYLRKDGTTYFAVCRLFLLNLRYRKDEAFREAQKQRSLRDYYRRKEEHSGSRRPS